MYTGSTPIQQKSLRFAHEFRPRRLRSRATHGSRCRAAQIGHSGSRPRAAGPGRTEQACRRCGERRWWVHTLAATDQQCRYHRPPSNIRAVSRARHPRAFSMNDLLRRSGRQQEGQEGARENRAVVTPAIGIARHRQKCLRFLGNWRRVALIAALRMAANSHKLRHAVRVQHTHRQSMLRFLPISPAARSVPAQAHRHLPRDGEASSGVTWLAHRGRTIRYPAGHNNQVIVVG